MKKNDDRAFGWEWLAMLVMAVVVYACASRGYPEGGPKDTTPPQVILEEPASFTKNFDKKRVNIYFDEFVQLKDINEKFIISPPQKKKTEASFKGEICTSRICGFLETEYHLYLGFCRCYIR